MTRLSELRDRWLRFKRDVIVLVSVSIGACSDSPTSAYVSGFELTYDDGFVVYKTDTTGTIGTELVRSSETMYDLSWSPDGGRAAFTRQSCPPAGGPCTYRVFVLTLATGAQTALAGGANRDATNPAWSPGGDLIAYLERPSEPSTNTSTVLRVVAPDGSGDRQVGTDRYYVRNPSWSPDGRNIAATSHDHVIVIVDVQSGERLRSLGSGYAPSWSPDGDRLAFTGDQNSLVTVSVNGDGRRSLGLVGFEPAWSPDGHWIAFEHWDFNPRGVAIVRHDGTGKRIVSDAERFAARPAWRRVP